MLRGHFSKNTHLGRSVFEDESYSHRGGGTRARVMPAAHYFQLPRPTRLIDTEAFLIIDYTIMEKVKCVTHSHVRVFTDAAGGQSKREEEASSSLPANFFSLHLLLF